MAWDGLLDLDPRLRGSRTLDVNGQSLRPRSPAHPQVLGMRVSQLGVNWAPAIGRCIERMAGQAVQYEHAVRVQPRRADAHHNWATVLLSLGDLAGAKTHYRRALELNPADEIARRRLAQLASR